MSQKRKRQKIGLGGNGVVAVIIIVTIFVIFCLFNRGTFDRIFGNSDKAAVSAEMSVHFIDVGQGDSILVICDGEAMLIDAGEKDCGSGVAEYLDLMKVKELKYVVGTHPHSDHIGGLAYVIENFKVGTFILPKVPDDLVPTTTTYENLLETVKQQGLKIHAAKDEVLELGSCKVEVFAPLGDYDDLNDYSVCIKLTHGDNTFLLTGDTEAEAERNLVMRSGASLNAKVLKLGHHGSSTSSSVELLDAVKPRYAVISCGAGNKYGHPHDETVERVEKYAKYILRTDISGTIIFESDGKGLNVRDPAGNDLAKNAQP